MIDYLWFCIVALRRYRIFIQLEVTSRRTTRISPGGGSENRRTGIALIYSRRAVETIGGHPSFEPTEDKRRSPRVVRVHRAGRRRPTVADSRRRGLSPAAISWGMPDPPNLDPRGPTGGSISFRKSEANVGSRPLVFDLPPGEDGRGQTTEDIDRRCVDVASMRRRPRVFRGLVSSEDKRGLRSGPEQRQPAEALLNTQN